MVFILATDLIAECNHLIIIKKMKKKITKELKSERQNVLEENSQTIILPKKTHSFTKFAFD